MENMINSIKENGILSPTLVRPKNNGRYEMISGHRRKKASEILKLETLPCIVRNLTDDEAIIIMVDSNLQREKILPSEKAYAYKIKLEAMKHQGKTSDQLEPKLTTTKIGIKNNESASTVKRYIRLTELIPKLLEMVDNDILKKHPSMALSPAVAISHLTKKNRKNY